tara:strand:- start:338 stop:532 length:195 start_codon:yes stop_codon:yes gene_type:complete
MKKNSLNIIGKISNIRSKNNKNWMDLLKLAFKNDPKAAAKILNRITNYDQEISKLTKKLHKLNR